MAWRPECLPEDDVGIRDPDRLGGHDLVGDLLLDQAVLVDARLVGEGVGPDDRLVRLDGDARDLREEPRGLVDVLGLDPRLEAEEVLPGLEGHDHLLHRAVPRPLADPVDRALHLARPVLHGGQRIGRGEAEVVVAVDRDDRLADVRHPREERRDQVAELLRDGIAHRVRDVDRRRPRGDDRLDHLAEVVPVAPGRVHRGELDVLRVAAGVGDRGDGLLEDLGARLAELVFQVDVR